MKKSLLLFFTLLTFVGNVWGWTEGIKDSDDALTVGKTREYQLPSGKSNPTKFHFSVASGLYWGGYDVKVRKYTSSTSYTEETRSFSGKAVQTYQEATVELSHNVIKVAIINTNYVANEYIHDVVWEGEDPAVGNCTSSYSKIDKTALDETSGLKVSNLNKRKPVITFDYEYTEVTIFGKTFTGYIKLFVGGTQVWTSQGKAKTGSCTYMPSSPLSYPTSVEVKYYGKVKVSNIKITQSSYAEIKNKSDISFGDKKTIGSTWTDKTFGTKWASYKGDVTCTSNQFSVTPTSIGSDDDCKYKDNQIITVSFNPTQPGLHTGYVYVGNQRVKVSGEAKLAKPEVTATATGKGRINISWNALTGADSYNIYTADGDSIDNVKTTSYTISGLDEKTEYGFKIKGISGVGEKYDSEMSAVAKATTYTTSMATEITGVFGSQGSVSVTSTAWNEDEKSYAIGSTATVAVSSLPANCEVDSIAANGVDVTTTAQFEVIAENSVVVTYRYAGTGVAEVIDSHGNVIYGTLTDAVAQAEDGADINLLGDVAQDLTVDKHIFFNGNGFKINNLYIKKNGNVELTGDVTVVKDFGLEVSAARSGQFLENGGQIQVTGRAYIDKVLEENGVGDYNKWYSVAVPFQVSIKDGIYIVGNDGSETKAKFNSDYAMFEYDGALRAAGTSRLPEWALADSEKNMKVGTFYLFGLGKSGPNVFRFYKADNAELITLDKTLTLTEYASSKSIDAGWNGIGNSQLYHVGIETTEYQYAQVLENNKFTTVDIAETSFAVTTPMFIQAAGDGSVSLNPKKDGTLRSASVSSAVYNIRLAKEGAEKYSDQMFASASSDATGSYTIGRDLVKFEVSTAYPQLYTRGFNTNLSVHEAAYNELSIAEMPLYMFAPEAGNYTLSLGKDVLDGTALYLVKDGAEIHNFSNDGAYTLYLAKGTTSTYSLRISAATGDVPTIVEDENGSEIKIYVKEGVLVIEGLGIGESYNLGNMVRTLYYGVSNGGNITVPLSEQGVYWVKTGNKVVKVLNK